MAGTKKTHRKVSYCKYMGNDPWSYAVFLDGIPIENLNGLNINQARYYQKLVQARLAERNSTCR